MEGLAGWGRERVGYWVEGHVAGVDHCCYDLEGVRVGGLKVGAGVYCTSGEARKFIVCEFPSFLARKFLLYEVRIAFVSP